MIAIKPGVLLENLTPQMVFGHTIVASIFAGTGYGVWHLGQRSMCTITSGSDGTHMEGSRHPDGNALDYRTNHLTDAQKSTITAACKEALGENFDVVLEADHLHVEYDPKAAAVAVA
jgi:hypothetical protein